MFKEATNANIVVGEESIEDKLRKYYTLLKEIEERKAELEKIKMDLRRQGIGTDHTEKIEIDDIGIARICLKKVTRESVSKDKAKQILPQELYEQVKIIKEYDQYEIRFLKKNRKSKNEDDKRDDIFIL